MKKTKLLGLVVLVILAIIWGGCLVKKGFEVCDYYQESIDERFEMYEDLTDYSN